MAYTRGTHQSKQLYIVKALEYLIETGGAGYEDIVTALEAMEVAQIAGIGNGKTLADLHALFTLAVAANASTGPTVGSSTTAILVANASRTHAIVVNDSDEVIYLGLGVAAVLNRGIRLNAAGGWYEITLTNLFKGAINAICTSGSKVATVTELE